MMDGREEGGWGGRMARWVPLALVLAATVVSGNSVQAKSNFGEPPQGEVRRMNLPRTPLNRIEMGPFA